MRDAAVLGVVCKIEREGRVPLEHAAPLGEPRAERHVDVELQPLVGALGGLVAAHLPVGEEQRRVRAAVLLVRRLPRDGLAVFGLEGRVTARAGCV